MKKNFWNFFMPDTNQVFFNLFNEATANTRAMADLLYKALNIDSADDRQPHFNHINRLKATSAELRQQVYAVSTKTFISPFERDDMMALASAIDKVSNNIDIAGRRINLYIAHAVPPFAKELAGVIADCCHELEKAIKMLDNLKQADAITSCGEQVKVYESYADNLYNKAVTLLLSDHQDTLELIKHTDILMSLERATDRCEHVTQVLETIIIKNS